MLVSYNWLKSYIPECIEAEKLVDIFTFHICEVEEVVQKDDDVIFDLKILPDRAGDLLSHIGVARELAGVLGIGFVSPESKYIIPNSTPTNLSIDIQTTKVKRYMGRIVRNVTVGPSPSWVSKMLESIGQRSINNIVDATNLVMFDIGQPMHAFDLNKLASPKITVKESIDDFEFPLVGNENSIAKIKTGDMLIYNDSAPIALAGIKGGVDSGISVSNSYTTDIILEVANFDSTSIRKTAQRLSLFSDARKRFENNVPPVLAEYAMKEISSLIYEMCPNAQFEDIVDVYPEPFENKQITFSLKQINTYLGTALHSNQIIDILNRYRYTFTQNQDLFILDIPYYRQDIVGVHDIVDEIGRIYGYENITPVLPRLVNTHTQDDVIWADIHQVRQHLAGLKYREVITYSFTKKGDYQVARGPKGKDFLRTNLTDGLRVSLELNRLNAPLLGVDEIKIFEIGTVFTKDGEKIHVAYGDKKNITEIPLHDYIDFISHDVLPSSSNTSNTLGNNPEPFELWSSYPFIVRDISFWVNSPSVTIESEIIESLKTYIKKYSIVFSPKIIDRFIKNDTLSLALRFVFQSKEKTLSDDEVNHVFNEIVESFKNQYGSQITIR